MVWASGDPLTVAAMNNQGLSSLTLDSGSTAVSALLLSVQTDIAVGPSRPVGLFQITGTLGSTTGDDGKSFQALEGYNRTNIASGATVTLSMGLIANSEHTGAGHVLDMRALTVGGVIYAGSVHSWQGGYINPPAAQGGSINTLVGLAVVSNTLGSNTNSWSGTTNIGILTNGSISLVSSTASIPTAATDRGYLYTDSTGALYWFGGSGTSTKIANA